MKSDYTKWKGFHKQVALNFWRWVLPTLHRITTYRIYLYFSPALPQHCALQKPRRFVCAQTFLTGQPQGWVPSQESVKSQVKCSELGLLIGELHVSTHMVYTLPMPSKQFQHLGTLN